MYNIMWTYEKELCVLQQYSYIIWNVVIKVFSQPSIRNAEIQLGVSFLESDQILDLTIVHTNKNVAKSGTKFGTQSSIDFFDSHTWFAFTFRLPAFATFP